MAAWTQAFYGRGAVQGVEGECAGRFLQGPGGRAAELRERRCLQEESRAGGRGGVKGQE